MGSISIPGTELSLCPIGLGTAGAGVAWQGADADRMFDTYLDLGGNVIDTARVYSDWVPPEIGRSERVVGDWLHKSGKRDRIVLMTKGGHPKFTSPTDDLHIPRMTRDDMRRDLELSLKTLRVDTIDIYFYHRDNRAQSVEEQIETMEEFRSAGKVRYYGCSNWEADRILEADAYCAARGYRGLVADQALLNFGTKYIGHLPDDTWAAIRGPLFEYHVKHPRNLAIAYMGVANGFFHKFAALGEEKMRESPYYTSRNVEVANRCMDLAKRYDATISQVLLGFLFQQPFACAALYGPRDTAQLKDAMGALRIGFKKEDFII